ncbi:MAG: hypothetical protein OXH96_23245 [Spirochaetaceae bacterium]|nr:hypothetical protein [Spirochaetaceae bacterium]
MRIAIPVDHLNFDRHSARLVEFGVTPKTTDEEMIQLLWDTMDIHELVLSISAGGFFRYERLVVAREAGNNIVIEGNRRLAAVRVLLEPGIVDSGQVTIPKLSRDARESLNELPVLIGTRRDSSHHLGFKHINGPAKWGSYAKSRYIADVHRKYDVPLGDIARQIGDNHGTVQRLYRALMVLEQAERLRVFDRSDRYYSFFSFSLLVFAVDCPEIREFIGLQSADDEATCPVPDDKRGELGELLRWVYGSKRESQPPVIARQNPHLRQLAAVLGNREAVAALRDGIDLDVAFELSRPASTVFEEALLDAKGSLQKAHRLLSTGYEGSRDLLGITGTVADLAGDLYGEIERKHRPRRRRRVAEC